MLQTSPIISLKVIHRSFGRAHYPTMDRTRRFINF